MEIQNILLHNQINNLQKQNAFLKMKINMLEDKKALSQITLLNKQLYLNYMEQVLNNKQSQLLQSERNLEQQKIKQNNKQACNNLLNPLQNSTQIDIFLKKLEQIKKIMISQNQFQSIQNKSRQQQQTSFQMNEWKQFAKNEQKIVQQCRNYQRQTQNLIKNQYESLIRKSKQLSQNMDKFQQLNSYEKYLNQLQKILQVKQHQILKRQDQLYKFQEENIMPTTLSFRNENSYAKQGTQKKRVKYIQSKFRIFESAKKSQIKKGFPQQIYNSKQSSNVQRNFISKDQSSLIMQESQNTQRKTLENFYTSKNQVKQITKELQLQNIGIQTNIQTIQQSLQRISKQKNLLKFANLWLKFSLHSKKNSPSLIKKTIGLYLWRINTVFDSSIPEKVKIINQDWTEKYEESLKTQQLFPYAQLSLNRKKYVELTLDYERKLMYKKKVQMILRSIIRNKNMKERMIFVSYFKKFGQKSKLKMINQLYNSLSPKSKGVCKDYTTTGIEGISQCNLQSRLISANSSRIMVENKSINENKQQRKQGSIPHKKPLNKKSMSNTNILTVSSQPKAVNISKQNINPSDGLDIKKLKQYIKQHQETEKGLAIQCVKTQSICKLGQSLVKILNRSLVNGLHAIRFEEENIRFGEMQKRINKYEFKWEMFMTKCKLGLMNNNNKISHLEETLGFMLGK